MNRPNVVFVLADQLRAASLPLYGETQVETPHIDRFAADSVVCDNALSTCPICTPYRGMLLTGRHPQTTGHVGNFIGTRHDEISVGDAFAAAGYRTAWVGKWHLQVGSWPGPNVREGEEGAFHIPEGRQRMGFEHWRAYNFHEQYFNGWVNKDNWRNETWDGYETEGLNKYGFEFMDQSSDQPFCLFLSPHQPHHTTVGPSAPDEYYANVPKTPSLPGNVAGNQRDESVRHYRDYLAMTAAVDAMLGELMDYLERTGRANDTLVVFTSDHGSQFGAHGLSAWTKACPYEESIRVPLLARLPGRLEGGRHSDALISPVDLFPTLCGLCDVKVPRSVEGLDLSSALLGEDGAAERDAALTMNFSCNFCFFDLARGESGEGNVWRGVRAKTHSYFTYSNGRSELYDLRDDPQQMNNLAGTKAAGDVESQAKKRLAELLEERGDAFGDGTEYASWFDSQRRIVRNAFGELGHPENPPDWSLLK